MAPTLWTIAAATGPNNPQAAKIIATRLIAFMGLQRILCKSEILKARNS